MLSHFRIVLVNTSHPGNIGATARAMKTMGLTQLYLVAPKEFPHPKAVEMASGAQDVLENAIVVQDVSSAIGDCHLVVGTSTRLRTIPWPLLTPRQFADQAFPGSSINKVAVLFGREQSGLTNEELQLCHFHIQVPSNPEYSSLNVAAAVQIIAYELYTASLGDSKYDVSWDCPHATFQDMHRLYEHLERVLIKLQFLDIKAPRQLMTRLRRLFNRSRLDIMELNILRGILRAIEKK